MEIKITSEEKEKLLKEQHEYYSKTFVLFEILKELKNREFALLNSKLEEHHIATRFLYASNFEYLKKHLEALGIFGNKLINLYRSNALLKANSIPISTWNLKERSSELAYQEFNKNFNNLIENFDFIIDIDTDDIMKSYSIAKQIKEIFDNYKLPYYLKNSGRRGFHLIIPADYQPKLDTPLKLIETIKNVMYNLSGIYDLKDYIDLSVTNIKGLIKCSFSFDSGNISLPLDDLEFEKFTPEFVKMENVLKKIYIKGRGLKIRKWGLSDEELRKNVLKFYREFS